MNSINTRSSTQDPPPSQDMSPRLLFQLLVLLTFAAGFVDTAGFLLLFELFTAHITGNTVIVAADIVHRGGDGAVAALLMMPIFIGTVVACTLFMDSARGRWKRHTLSLMIVAETVMLGIFCAAALLLDPSRTSPDALPVIVVGGIGVVAMGIQNTIAGELPKPSTVMTGNLTNLIIDGVRWIRALLTADRPLRAKTQARLVLLWPTFLAFSLGAVFAALGVVTLGYWSLLIPVPFSAAAAILSFRGRSRSEAEEAARPWG